MGEGVVICLFSAEVTEILEWRWREGVGGGGQQIISADD